MAKAYKRREPKKSYGPQKKRTDVAGQQKRKINWNRMVVIAIGVLISLSMILALFATPGSHPG